MIEEEAEAVLLALGPTLKWEQHGRRSWSAYGSNGYQIRVDRLHKDSSESYAPRYGAGMIHCYVASWHATLDDAKAACERHHATGQWE